MSLQSMLLFILIAFSFTYNASAKEELFGTGYISCRGQHKNSTIEVALYQSGIEEWGNPYYFWLTIDGELTRPEHPSHYVELVQTAEVTSYLPSVDLATSPVYNGTELSFTFLQPGTNEIERMKGVPYWGPQAMEDVDWDIVINANTGESRSRFIYKGTALEECQIFNTFAFGNIYRYYATPYFLNDWHEDSKESFGEALTLALLRAPDIRDVSTIRDYMIRDRVKLTPEREREVAELAVALASQTKPDPKTKVRPYFMSVIGFVLELSMSDSEILPYLKSLDEIDTTSVSIAVHFAPDHRDRDFLKKELYGEEETK